MSYRLINVLKTPAVTKNPQHSSTKIVCAGGFLVKNNKFLFGKRSKKKDWAPGLWDIVGGHALTHEHPLLTLRRETLEETGLQVMNAELLTNADVIHDADSQPLFTYHIYMVTHFKGKAYNRSNEHTMLQWFTRAELDEIPLALPEYRTLIDAWLHTAAI